MALLYDAREVDRKVLAILRILSGVEGPLGARLIARELEQGGINLKERAVRYHLKLMDGRGLTRLWGRNGRRFVLYKFRSMYYGAQKKLTELERLNEASGPVFKIKNDPRITPIGRILRKFSIDEFPQFWNVLRGDMSIVGARPPLPREVRQYEPWQRKRLSMRPGLTCLWQISGRNRIAFDEWIKLDLQYIDNWSLWLDFKIFIKTIPVVILGIGAH